MAGLRIVRGAHDVAFEFMAQDARIAALGAARHRLSHERKGLMTVEAAQVGDFAIQPGRSTDLRLACPVQQLLQAGGGVGFGAARQGRSDGDRFVVTFEPDQERRSFSS